MKGIVFTSDHRKNLSLSRIGMKFSKSHKLALSNLHKGKKLSQEHKDRISSSMKGKPSNTKGMKFSEERKQQMRERRGKQTFPLKDSKPEKMMQLALTLENVPFETHKSIYGQPDIFIKPNICIFIDGCYWHNCSMCKRSKNYLDFLTLRTFIDNKVNHKLTVKGFIVIRIWEHDIINADDKVKLNVVNMIKHITQRLVSDIA